MSVGLEVKVNADEVIKKLNSIPTKVAKQAMEKTFNDLSKRGPSIIAKYASQTYNVAKGKLNPNTKSGAGHGSLSVGGGTLASLSWTYTGERGTIGDRGSLFKLMGGKYQTKTKILRGKTSLISAYSKAPARRAGAQGPWSPSPWMKLPGTGVALKRVAGGHHPNRGTYRFGDPARGLSIPQMILSVRHEDAMREELTERTLERLEHNMERALASL